MKTKPNAPNAKPAKTLKVSEPAHLDEKSTLMLAGTLAKVAKCLLMCAPPFPEGSEGAECVAIARRSIPLVRNILEQHKARLVKKGGAK